MSSIYDFEVKDSKGNVVPMSEFRNKALVIVNVASKCGYTPQYTGLEALYEKFKDKGLVVLGFPCNQFGAQEPGSDSEIQQFCSLTYNVTFPVLSKVDVNGDGAHPLYKFLKEQKPGLLGTEAIKWNFTKFLVDKQGNVVDRFAPQTEPSALEGAVTKVLQ